MKAREIVCYRVYCHIQAYLDSRPDMFDAINATGMRQGFDRIVSLLGSLVTEAGTLANTTAGEKTRVESLRQDLFDCHLVPIVAFAMVLKESGKLPFLVVKLPSSEFDATTLELESKTIHKCVEPHKEAFIEMGLAPDFLEQLWTAAETLSSTATNRALKVAQEGGVVIGSAKAVTLANAYLRAINALVIKRVREHPELLTEWNRVRQLPSHRRQGDGTGAPRLRPGTPQRVIARVITETPALTAGSTADVGIAQPVVGGQPRRLMAGVRRLLSGG